MKALEIRESKSGEITIVGLSAIEVLSMKEVINFLAEGIKVGLGLFRIGPLVQHRLISRAHGRILSSMSSMRSW